MEVYFSKWLLHLDYMFTNVYGSQTCLKLP